MAQPPDRPSFRQRVAAFLNAVARFSTTKAGFTDFRASIQIRPLREWGDRHNNAVAISIAAVGFVVMGAVGLWPGELLFKSLLAFGLLVFLAVITWLLNDVFHWSKIGRIVLISAGSLLGLCDVLVMIAQLNPMRVGANNASSPPQYAASPVPSPQPQPYGYLALRCTFGRQGSADADYTLYQHPENLQAPMFIGLPSSFDATIQQQSMETCVLHNDGLSPVYNLALSFGYILLKPLTKGGERFSDSQLTPSDLLILRIAASSAYTFRIVDDLPGVDLGIAPTGKCSMDTPGQPGAREKCVLPKDPLTDQYVIQFAVILFHHRSLNDCRSGFVPPLAQNQQNCPGHSKVRHI